MDALRAKMQEFLKMETEISYEEFNEYYKSVMDFLQREFENLDQDGLVTMSGICQIMYLNAGSRGQRKRDVYKRQLIDHIVSRGEIPVFRKCLNHQFNVGKNRGIRVHRLDKSVELLRFLGKSRPQYLISLLHHQPAVLHIVDADDEITGPLKGQIIVFAVGATRLGSGINGDVKNILSRAEISSLRIEVEEFLVVLHG